MGGSGNAYEEARNLNILQNWKKLEEFGLPKTLPQPHLNNSHKNPKQRTPKPKPEPKDIQVVEPRRSSRPRNTVSYRDDLDIHLPPLQKRSRTNSSSRGSSDEINLASDEERARAIKAAEELQSSFQSLNPSFIKPMVRSHVSSCFWLGLPTQFCKTHLSESTVEMVLEDENGEEFAATYIGRRVGLSGGWKAFALEHKLDDGDALVFELIEPTRFKIYITRLSSISSQEHNAKVLSKEVTGAKKTSKGAVNSQPYQTRKSKKANLCGSDDFSSPQEPQPQNGVATEGPSEVVDQSKKSGFISQKVQKKGKLSNAVKSEEPRPQNGVASEVPSEVVDQSKKNGFISQKGQKQGDLSNAGKSQEPRPQNGVASEGPSEVADQSKKNGFISQKGRKKGKLSNAGNSQEPQPQNGVASEGPSEVVDQSKKNGFISQKGRKKGKLSNAGNSQEPQPQNGVASEGPSEIVSSAGKSSEVESGDKRASYKPRNRKERLLRKRAW